MWNSLVRRVLPRSAIDKVVFLESKEDTEAFFDLSLLPKGESTKATQHADMPEYGGLADAMDPEAMLRRYAHPRPSMRTRSRRGSMTGPTPARSRQASRERHRAGPSRNASNSSMADVYYTANHTPSSSRPGSRSNSRGPSRHGSSHGLSALNPRLAMTKPDDEDKPSLNLDTKSPIQRIKSLSDFHLYLSPSRLAHRDLLSDSEDDTPDSSPRPSPQPPMLSPNTVQRRRMLRPAMLEGSIAARRAASRGKIPTLPGVRASTPAEYASQLSAHHARGLDQYCSDEQLDTLVRRDSASQSPKQTPSPPRPEATSPKPEATSPAPRVVQPTPHLGTIARPAPEVQFSSANPWFGYPVIRGSDGSVRPRYGRNRKRDLVKTLLWLFLMRLQAWRDTFERALGLHKVQRLLSRRTEQPRTPTEGLRQVAAERRGYPSSSSKALTRTSDRDWIWMVIGFLLFRSSWTRLLGAPLEVAGMDMLRSILGM